MFDNSGLGGRLCLSLQRCVDVSFSYVNIVHLFVDIFITTSNISYQQCLNSFLSLQVISVTNRV